MKEIRKDNGSALVIVLGMLAVLMLMAVAFSVIMRVERAGTTNLRHSLTAQNGLQSAISQALSDIDRALGDDISPKKWKNGIMATQSTGVSYDILSGKDKSSDIKVSILNEKAQRHLNPTTRALVKNAKVDWRLLYAGIPLSNYADGGNRLSEDSIVGRIAYVAVNTTGYLDPNMVSEDGIIAYPEMTHQLNNESFARLNNRNVKFVSSSLLDARESNGRKGFTSFADLVALNESQMYSGGKVKGAPKMYINLFPPNKTSCLFLPDVFGPAATFGMSPYPPQVEIEDQNPLTSPVDISEIDELDVEEVLLAFRSVFSRKKWIEKGDYGEDKGKDYHKDKKLNAYDDGEISWSFQNLTRGDGFCRSDFALLSFAALYGDEALEEKVIKAINDVGGQKIVKGDIRNAPCFKQMPLFSSIIGWTEKPKFAGLYSKNESGEFPKLSYEDEGPEEVVITSDSGKSTKDYYARYILPVNFKFSAVSLYENAKPGEIKLTLKFGPDSDGENVFNHFSGNQDVIVDPNEVFAKFIEGDVEFNGGECEKIHKTGQTYNMEDDFGEDGFIEIYVRCPEDKKPADGESITINKDSIKWVDAKFDTSSLEKYSIDVFAEVEITSDVGEQNIPAPGYRKKTSGIYFKLPLFRDNDKSKDFHRVGYAMALDPRFAFASYCLHEYEGETSIDEDLFPYWVNNVMAEKIGAFNKLQKFEREVEDPDDLIPGGRSPDIANPYARLAMGFSAVDGEAGCGDDSLWDAIRVNDGGVRPYPDTLHKVPSTAMFLANKEGYDNKDFEIENDSNNKQIENLGELGSLCIGPWETISLYSTETPDGNLDFHTVLDFFTLDAPTELIASKINLNAPPLLMTQEGSKGRVKFAIDHGGSYANTESFDIDGKVKIKDYVDASNGLNPEPLMALLYGLKFDYRTSWELASRIIYQNMDLGSSDGVNFFKDISQIGYGIGNDSLLEFMLNDKNSETFVDMDYDVTSDASREKLLGNLSNYVTTRGQTFTIVIRSDAFAPKYGSDVDGTTLASKVAIVEAWRDTEPARDSEGNSLGYHNWHIRSVRIVD